MTTSTLTSKGQTTVPRELREELGLKPGDKLEFSFDEVDGVNVVTRIVPADEVSAPATALVSSISWARASTRVSMKSRMVACTSCRSSGNWKSM